MNGMYKLPWLGEEVEELLAAILDKANKATTLDGYGITNAYTKDEIDEKLGKIDNLTELAELLRELEENTVKISDTIILNGGKIKEL